MGSGNPSVVRNFTQPEKETGYFTKLAELYDLDSCIWWIRNNKFENVCLQFPETLLIDSVDIASYIEINIPYKVYILPEKLKDNCCVNEVTVRQMRGNAVIHFGHTCLSSTQIPVYYVFHKKPLNVKKFLDSLEDIQIDIPLIILYDVGYYHITDDLRDRLSERISLRDHVCIADLVLPSQSTHHTACSAWCSLRKLIAPEHSKMCLHRTYCTPPYEGVYLTLVYLGEATQNLFNFLHIFKDCKAMNYTEKAGFKDVCRACVEKQMNNILEKIKAARTIGIVVPSITSQQQEQAVEHISTLSIASGKKVSTIALTRPDLTKLTKFSDIDIFVSVSCPETDIFDKKQANMPPIVGFYELNKALNKSRQSPKEGTRDFREIIDSYFNKPDTKPSTSWDQQTPLDSRLSMSFDSIPYSIMSPDGSFISISTSSLARVATSASMRAAHAEWSTDSTTSFHKNTYNINKLMNHQLNNRVAQSLVHQMKTVNNDDVIRMKAYQVTQKKPVRDPFVRADFTVRHKEEFWAKHNMKNKTTMILERIPEMKKRADRYVSTDSKANFSSEFLNREQRIDKKLREIKNLSHQIRELLESQEKYIHSEKSPPEIYSIYSQDDESTLPGKDGEEKNSDEVQLGQIISRAVLDQLTNPQRQRRETRPSERRKPSSRR